MTTRRAHLAVAAIELTCGVGVAIYLVVVGLTADGPDRTAVDRAFPFALAALALAVLGGMAWRSVRRSRDRPVSVASDRCGDPGVTRQQSRIAGTPRATTTTTTATTTMSPPAEVPELSPEGRTETERLLRVLARAGVLPPTVPDVDAIAEAVADAGEPPTAGSVLGAIGEAGFWHPGFDAGPHLANLAFHDGHAEQFADTLREQVDDLARLVGDALTVRLEHVEITDDWRHHLRLRLGDDVADLDYAGHVKYLSTVLHVAVARAARAAGARLAWLWVDQGVYIAVPAGGLAELNAVAPEHERWSWVDEDEPMAAGAL
ncbi:hypothetical protein [Actinomycetospora flava]|uniref:Uncharacterized protein n=1 Tax=Actinomycetospora flava TaxID=3129232 RepID=A0ABU8M133_9PSEU